VAEDVEAALAGKSTPKAAATRKSTPVTKKSTPAAKKAAETHGGGTPRRSRRVSEITSEAAAEDLTPRASRTRTATTEVAANPVLEKVKEVDALTKVRSKSNSSSSPSTKTPTRGRGRSKLSTPVEETTTTLLSDKKAAAKSTPRAQPEVEPSPNPAAAGLEGEKRLGTRRKLTSESSQDGGGGRLATPTRKSRRLSGSIPEFEDSPVVLPLKKRRSSLSLEPATNNEESTPKPALPEIKEAVEVSPGKSCAEVEATAAASAAASAAESVATLDVIEEEESDPSPLTQKCEETMAVEEINVKEKNDSTLDIVKEKESNPSPLTQKCEEKSVGDDATNKKKDEMKIFEDLQRLILINHIPRQKPKSGKFWKQSRSQFRQIKRDRGQRKTFEDRLRLKEDRQRNQELANQIKQAKLEKRQEILKRIEENKKAKEERQLKNEVYQVVKNPNKIKRMKKRDLAKRDILGKI